MRFVAISEQNLDTCKAVNWAWMSVRTMVAAEGATALDAWSATGDDSEYAVHDTETGRVYSASELRGML